MDVKRAVARARRARAPGWEAGDVEDALRRHQRRLTSRGRRRAFLLGAGMAVLAAVVVAVAWLGQRTDRPALQVTPTAARPVTALAPAPAAPATAAQATVAVEATAASVNELHLCDGSRATLTGPSSSVHVREDTPAAVTVELRRGGCRFDVTPSSQRVFRVEAGDIAVLVVGTSFTVSRDSGGVEVLVHEGRVVVEDRLGARGELTKGERGWFTLRRSSGPSSRREAAVAPAPPSTPGWIELAERGQYAEAFDALAASGMSVNDEPGELLLAADAARLSGHPAAAVRLLEQLVDGHGRDPRAPLAAFTLGRVLLGELRQPTKAAAAFARARALAPGGLVAEDALAREIEAWARAGERELARARAEEYFRLHPDGAHADAVRLHGGLP